MAELLFQHFRQIHLLGEGGFGQTFLVEDLRLDPPHPCVLKILKFQDDPRLFNDANVRFQREAMIQKQLAEQAGNGIARVFDFFPAGNSFVLVQEWIDGVTLAERVLRQKVLTEPEALSLMVWTLKLLKLMHNQPVPIIHRDVKPQNLMLRRKTGKVVLIDFGAVKQCTSVNAQSSTLAIGTQGYMAVEQAVGRPVFATDIFGLGMTTIFALTGLSPDMFSDPRNGKVRWPNGHPPISEGFWRILQGCTEPNLADRYASCEAVEGALERLVPELRRAAPPALGPTQAAVPLPATVAFRPDPPDFQIFENASTSPRNSKVLLFPLAVVLVGIFAAFLWYVGYQLKPTKAPENIVSAPPRGEDLSHPVRNREDWFPIISKIESAAERSIPKVSAKVQERVFSDLNKKIGNPTDYSGFPAQAIGEVKFQPEIHDIARGSFSGPGKKEILYTVLYDSGASHANVNSLYWVMVYDQSGLVQFDKIDHFNVYKVDDLDGDGVDEVLLAYHYQQMGHEWEGAVVAGFRLGYYEVIRDFGTVYEETCATGIRGQMVSKTTTVDARCRGGQIEFRTQTHVEDCSPK
jgi:serine/threonine protein kinase